MVKRLTDVVTDALAKGATEEELLEERDREDAEALQAIQDGRQRSPAAERTDLVALEAPVGAQAPPAPGPAPIVKAVTRPDPILPVVRVQEHPAREIGRLAFGGLVEGRQELPPAQLPLFEAGEDGPRVGLLELADVSGVPTMARGRGAPLDLRLAVGACVLAPYMARGGEERLAVTVRQLRDFLFPHGWRRVRDWPRVREALYRLALYSLPGWGGRRWVALVLQTEPGEDPALDDLVVIQMLLPPGGTDGPPIDKHRLARFGVESAPRFRAYIAARSLVWAPGKTRRPVPGTDDRWGWSRSLEDYPILTSKERDRLAYGAAATALGLPRGAKDAHWRDLPGVVVATEEATLPDGRTGWRIVPAEVVKNREDGGR